MAIAKECDICKKFYNIYNEKNDSTKPNGIIMANIDANLNYYASSPIDCCPNCINAILNVVNNLQGNNNTE